MITDETAIVAVETQMSTALSADAVKSQVIRVHEVMQSVMKPETHYDTIPGCGTKPTLLQPGAQVLALTFNLAATYKIDKSDLGGGHREYEVICELTSRQSGLIVGSGVGSCSTMESKYRYRTGEVTFTGKPVPKEYWAERDIKLIGGPGHKTKKNPDTGQWEIVEQGEKVENPDIADVYNTVLKIAKKRAFVDAVLTVTAASDMFTQDIEDMGHLIKKDAETRKENTKTGPQKNTLLDNFKKTAESYHNLTGMPHRDIAKQVSQRLGKSVSAVSSEQEALEAEAIIRQMFEEQSELYADKPEPEYDTEDIPF
jgi:hypothetical protein